jgi:hypothetical protein
MPKNNCQTQQKTRGAGAPLVHVWAFGAFQPNNQTEALSINQSINLDQSINQSIRGIIQIKKNVTTTSKHSPSVDEGIILVGATL